jgi:hypothetical protein
VLVAGVMQSPWDIWKTKPVTQVAPVTAVTLVK